MLYKAGEMLTPIFDLHRARGHKQISQPSFRISFETLHPHIFQTKTNSRHVKFRRPHLFQRLPTKDVHGTSEYFNTSTDITEHQFVHRNTTGRRMRIMTVKTNGKQSTEATPTPKTHVHKQELS